MRWVLPFALLIASPAVGGDSVQRAPPAAVATPVPDPIPSLADQLTFGKNGPRMTVPVRIAENGPYPFIIDTGAERTVISRQLASTLRLSPGGIVRLVAMSGVGDVKTVVIPSISVSSLDGERIEAPALDGANLGAPGMLGIDTLQGHALSIDFDRQIMAVTPSEKRERKERAAPGEIVVRAKSLLGQLVVTDAYCGNQRVRVILDTGSVVTIGNDALRRRVMHGRKPEPINLISVTGGMLSAQYTTLQTLKIGDININNLPIAFANAAPFRQFALEKTPAIMLGMDAIQMFRRVQIDFANREVRFVLPRDAREASPFGQVGAFSGYSPVQSFPTR